MATQSVFGKRLVPHVVDQLAQSQPDSTWAGLPKDDNNLKLGYKFYTFANFANAVNILAHQIERELGGKSSNFDTIAYIGPNDPRYIVVVIAAIKAGYKTLLISPRNSIEGNVSLFKKTNCVAVVHAATHIDLVNTWKEKKEMKLIAIPDNDELLYAQQAPEYPYTRTFEEAQYDPFVIIHTSGSTGIPKPIVVKSGMIAMMDAFKDLEDFKGQPNYIKFISGTSSSLFMPMPLFHSAGLYATVGHSIYYARQYVLPPPSKPVSANTVEDVLRHSGADAAFIANSVLEDMSSDPDSVKLLASLNFVCTGGSNIATNVGDTLVAGGVRFHNFIGSTEHCPYPIFAHDPKNWAYFCIQDEPSGFEWRPVGEGLYELFVVRKDKHPGLQGCFWTFPELDEWSTRDLFRKHPSEPNLWIYAGRADNVIVLSNGEKLNPVSIEDELTGHPKVMGALVVGQDRFQPALIIEPRDYPETDEETAAFLDEIWPTVEKANQSTVKHGQIHRSYVTLTARGKGFPRAGKGSIQRAMAASLYHDETEALYKAAEEAAMKGVAKLDLSSQETVLASVQQIVAGQLHHDTIGPDADFFAAGMDSLVALTVSRALTGSLKQALDGATKVDFINPRTIYSNPTAKQLASFLMERIGQPNGTHAQGAKTSQVDEVQAMADKYIKTLPAANSLSAPSAPATENLTVILTGSTGSIGSYVLDLLNKHPRIGKVFALNRGPDPQTRQISSSESRGLPTSYPKTTFFTTDLAQPRLGLSDEDYNSLVQETDAILHNQWRVDFNLSLASFEPHVLGTRNLIDLSAASPKRPRIVFVSTIADAGGWTPDAPSTTVPEQALPHHTIPADLGYGAGKLATTRILLAAAESLQIPVAVIRVGQVAGPVDRPQGSWNRWEWFPSIVASSAHLRALPETLGAWGTGHDISWAPVEREAALLVDLLLSPATGFFHGVNPKYTSYTTNLLPVLQEQLALQGEQNVIPWTEWVRRLEASEPDTQTKEALEVNPGVKLLDFYQSLTKAAEKNEVEPRFETMRSEEVSETWRTMDAVKPEWLRLWIQQWGIAKQ